MAEKNIKPKPKNKAVQSKSLVKEKKVPVDWNAISESLADLVEDRPLDYIILHDDERMILMGKRVKMTELIKNDNNIFQPNETTGTKYHYKFFHLYNPDKRSHPPKFESPCCFPSTTDIAYDYTVTFR